MTRSSHDICSLSGAEQARLIRQKALSPVELMDAVMDRIHALEPRLHAFCTLTEDSARAGAKDMGLTSGFVHSTLT